MGGEGCDIAVEAADIALVGDDIGKLAYLKRLSVACVRLIKLNISISMGINAVAIALSVLGLLTPVTGALVHNAGSLLVVLNAALLYDRNYLRGGKNAAAACATFGVDAAMHLAKPLNPGQQSYMAYHRDHVFKNG